MAPHPTKTLELATKMPILALDPADLATTLYSGAEPQESSFRFLDLPPETRNIIYFLVISSDTPINICSFNTPALTKVSKKLRSESLAIFFAESNFYINIVSNLHDYIVAVDISKQRKYTTEAIALRLLKNYGANYAGVIFTNRAVKDFVTATGGDGIFKNITFLPFESLQPRKGFREYMYFNARCSSYSPCVVLEAGGARSPHTADGEECLIPFFNECTTARVARIKRAASSETNPDDSKGSTGFTFGSLERIARQFRWTDEVLLEIAETGDLN